ncbi:hypothetical protein FRC02_002894 [Tulasnella sp. 418]|nr:hypothetical protein FRC02_002894 [Tulasnella sp. 418]
MDDIQREYIHGFYYSTADFRFDLFCGMYFPMFWNVLAQEIFKRAEEIRVFSATGHNPESRRQNGLTPLKRRLRKRIAMGSAINPVHFLSQLAINKAKGDGEDDDILPMNEHAYHAITCGDAIDTSNITTRVMLDEIISVTENVSSLYGPALSSEAGNYCHRWGVRAAERFTGPWNATLANRILVTGNTADPITPLSNSKWVADQFGDKATLLIQNAYGHTSYSMPSACTLHAIERYLISGELPSQNTTCETDTRLFDSPTGEAFVPDNVWDPPKATPVQAGSRISNSATYWKPSTSSFVLNGIFCIALSILIS